MPLFDFPAEGFTLEYAARYIRDIFLQPVLSGGLLLASWARPQETENAIEVISRGKVSPALFKGLVRILFAMGVVYRLNRTLTRRVLNNWVADRSWDFTREIVVVTGGCSGIGSQIVQDLTRRNIKVAVLDVNPPRSSLPPTANFYKADVTSPQNIKEAADKIRKDLGHPTVLVNCAGVGACKPMLFETEGEIRSTFEVNILAHFWMVREFVPDMVKNNHGHVVTIASMATYMVHASNVDYAASKAATLAFHEGLAQELKFRYNADRVRTTWVSPSLTQSDFSSRILIHENRVVHPTWVRTPLIERLSTKADFKDFVLEPITVAKAIVNQILKAESAQLIIPGRLTLIPLVRGFPSWLQEGMRNSVAGLLKDM
jgi:short-subunit dehydrogenase